MDTVSMAEGATYRKEITVRITRRQRNEVSVRYLGGCVFYCGLTMTILVFIFDKLCETEE